MRRIWWLPVLALACGPQVSVDDAGGSSSGGAASTTSGADASTSTAGVGTISTTGTAETGTSSGEAEAEDGPWFFDVGRPHDLPPETFCEAPGGANSEVTGVVYGEMLGLQYAWFDGSGGGKCPFGYRIVLVQTPDDLLAYVDMLPFLGQLPYAIEVFIEVPWDAELPIGEPTPAYARLWSNGPGDDSVQGTAIVDELVLEPPEQARITGSIAFDQVDFVLAGDFSAPMCTVLGSGGCGAQ